jgi:ribose transport system ATP-binding protein
VTPLLEARGLTKSFGGALALDQAELVILSGEVHGLLGENGSGKSTLIKILAGYHEPEAGSLTVNGAEVRLPLQVGQYRELGFEFVHQDLGLIPTLSVTENLFLSEVASPSNRYFISWKQATRRASEIFYKYGVHIDSRATVANIRPVERALLAIVRALEGLRTQDDQTAKGTLLVLDEPTVFLPQHEVVVLFDFVRGIARQGSSVLFVSHDLDEVRQITDRITVLRDGRVAGTVVTSQTTKQELVRLIIGHELQAMGSSAPADADVEERPTAMRVRGLESRTVHDVSFDLHQGEVLGLTGLVGSGYEDVIYALYGADPAVGGRLIIGERTVEAASVTPRAAMELGMALVPGDRQRDGSIPSLSAADNLNVPVLERFFRGGRLRHGELERNARSLMTAFDVRPAEPNLDYGSLSGGNQQKTMMAKWQQLSPPVMLLHEPTQGVDVGARQQIFEMIRDATDISATICASSDYEQLAAICDRVGVLARGRLVGFLTGADVTKERIADYCLRSSDNHQHVATPAGAGQLPSPSKDA